MQCLSPLVCRTNESWQCSRSSLHHLQRALFNSAEMTATLPTGAVWRVATVSLPLRGRACRPVGSLMGTTVGAKRGNCAATRPRYRGPPTKGHLMTLVDKAKVAAEKAAAAGKQGMQQGQAKIDAIQTKRKAEALLRELGAAYYAELRHGGSHDAVESVVRGLDNHEKEHGAVDAEPGGSEPEEG